MHECTQGEHKAGSGCWKVAVSIASAFLVSCGGGGGGGNGGGGGGATQPPMVQASSITLNVLGAAASSVSGIITATDPQGLPLTYSLTGSPAVGTAAVNAANGSFTYSVAGNTSSATDSFVVAVSNGKVAANATVTVQLKNDPLLVNQWHLQNLGGPAFSTVLPVAGNDLNVAGAWSAGATGRGVKVAVVDSGLEVGHEDLAANVDVSNSFNFLTGGNDPTPSATLVGDDHGTQVAGIIGAVAFNGKGGRGVAYSARLRGYNLIQSFSDANYAAAMGGMVVSSDNAVFNASFGNPTPALAPVDQTIIAANANLATLRSGRGAILVNAAGNAFTAFSGSDPSLCSLANTYGVSCGDPAQDTRLGGITPIIVGAMNAEGKRSSYSTTGSSLWVAAPGGEYGFDANYFDVSQLGDQVNAVKPAIVTTARDGCANRQYAPGVANALVTGNNPLGLNCQYTAQMNGTSSASPNVAGTVALMLEANPNLGYRDVKYILAKTARKIDPTFAGVVSSTIIAGTSITLEQGWVKNAAGYWFSNWYGFGAVDATAAVAMARTYATNIPAAQSSSTYASTPQAGLAVPALSTGGFSITANVNEPFATVEHVIIFPNLDATPAVACNQIEVVSPSGTRSIVLHAASGFAQTSVTGTRILSNAFYGEPINGNWTITFFNFCAGQTLLSATVPQSILFVGH
jgi:subtilisin family serine protease